MSIKVHVKINNGVHELSLLLLTSRTLKGEDGDAIVIADVQPNPATDCLTFTLKTQPGMWWKAIAVMDRSGNGQIADTLTSQEGKPSKWSRFEIDTKPDPHGGGGVIVDAPGIVLWKAKFLGIHTPMYFMYGSDFYPHYRGKSITFDWQKD